MYCTLCVREKKHNVFTAGTSNFRVKTIEMHIKGVDHKAVLESQHLRRNNVQVAVNRMVCARSKAVIAAMRNVYYLAKELLPTHKYKSLNELCILQGCETLAELRVSENAQYTHNDIVLDMQCAINNVLKEDLIVKENGVVARLKRENPAIGGTHCAAHKLNLCAQQAAAAIPSLQRYQRTVGSIYGYFSNSSRQARLKEMHVILDTDDVKLKSIHAVRWLSFGEANVALHRTMRTVAEVFQQDAELMHDTMAETLAKAMLTYEFIAINSLLCDILGTIACLSKAFQLKSLSFANVQPAVTSTINALRAMQIGDEGGPKFQEFLANIAENNGETYFKGEKIKATRAMRQAVDGVRQRFLDPIQNIEDRFPDIGLFSAFRIFDPRCLPRDNTERARFGRDELRTILDHLCPAGREPIVDTDTCSTEWPPFKELLHANYSKNSFQELVKIMATQHAGFLPETTKLLAAISVIPMSTVPCERGFSVQNRIKTKGRARLKAENLD
ncbi:hypothetical protein F7725_007029, partial [Dissostichus mawsoni]